jgi:hypothetical protein
MGVDTPRRRFEAADPGTRGGGWLAFASVMLMLIGLMNLVGGVAAIDDANVYVEDAPYVFSGLSAWGWVILLTGIGQGVAAIGLWWRSQAARWLGVGFAGLNAMAHLLMFPAFPLWSLALFAVDILVVYGLIAYGDRETA